MPSLTAIFGGEGSFKHRKIIPNVTPIAYWRVQNQTE